MTPTSRKVLTLSIGAGCGSFLIATKPKDLRNRGGRPMSAAEAQEVKNFLLQSDQQFRQLVDQHHELDDRLHQLIEKQYLSQPEQLEEVTLKKRKLAVK